MRDYDGLEKIFSDHGAAEFKWIDPRTIVTAQWVRAKCTFGCGNYGRHACCPPDVPSVPECRQLFSEYETGVVFHFAGAAKTPDDRRAWSKNINQNLLRIEREVFLQGHQKTLLLAVSPCSLCDECAGTKEECRHPDLARPTPEGLAIDVFSTVRKHGFPIEVLTDHAQTMNRYAFLLVE
jgi:predicted metal-binding protein